METNATASTAIAIMEMLNCRNCRSQYPNCRFCHLMSPGGGACFTTRRYLSRMRSDRGRKIHANKPGRKSFRHFKKLSSSWNVTYAMMLTCGSPIRSFWIARIAASTLFSSRFFSSAVSFSFSAFLSLVSGSSRALRYRPAALSYAVLSFSRSKASPSSSDVLYASCTSCTLPIRLSKNFHSSCGSITSRGMSRTATL